MTPLQSQGPEGDTAVYTILVVRDVPFYVGLTAYPDERLRTYRIHSWWKFVTRVDIQWFASRREAEAAEVATIQKYEGLHNRRHTLPWQPSEVVRLPLERVLVTSDDAIEHRFTLPVIVDSASFVGGSACPGFYDLSTVQEFAWRAGLKLPHDQIMGLAREGAFGPEGDGWISFYDSATHISARSLRRFLADSRPQK